MPFLLRASIVFLACFSVFAARAQGIFVTPIAGEPFTAMVTTERTTLAVQPDGKAAVLQSTSLIARDAEGRIRNEFRPPAPAAGPALPLASVHLYDPATRISSFLYPRQHMFQVTALNRPPATDTTGPFASATGSSYPQSGFAQQQDLGAQTIAGIETHGVRVTQTIPAAASGSGSEVVLTDEYWYSPELRLNLKITHNDPRVGSSSIAVVSLTRANPDASLFGIPADYQPTVPAARQGQASGGR